MMGIFSHIKLTFLKINVAIANNDHYSLVNCGVYYVSQSAGFCDAQDGPA